MPTPETRPVVLAAERHVQQQGYTITTPPLPQECTAGPLLLYLVTQGAYLPPHVLHMDRESVRPRHSRRFLVARAASPEGGVLSRLRRVEDHHGALSI